MSQACLQQFSNRFVTVGSLLGDQPVDDSTQPFGNIGIDLSNRFWLIINNSSHDSVGGFCSKRWPTRTHGIQHAAQAKQITALLHGFAASLLGRHKLRRARNDAAAGGVVDSSSQPKVGQRDSFDSLFQ